MPEKSGQSRQGLWEGRLLIPSGQEDSNLRKASKAGHFLNTTTHRKNCTQLLPDYASLFVLLARARSRKINVSCAVWWLALLRTRPGLSLSSLEDMLNVCPVLLILPSVMHWTHWFTWLVPTLHLSEAKAQLHVHEGQQQAGVTAEMGSVVLSLFTARSHLLSSPVQQNPTAGCTWWI